MLINAHLTLSFKNKTRPGHHPYHLTQALKFPKTRPPYKSDLKAQNCLTILTFFRPKLAATVLLLIDAEPQGSYIDHIELL